jgi:hypothetical protein
MQELNLLIVLSENKTIGNLTEFLADSEILLSMYHQNFVAQKRKTLFLRLEISFRL